MWAGDLGVGGLLSGGKRTSEQVFSSLTMSSSTPHAPPTVHSRGGDGGPASLCLTLGGAAIEWK